MSYASLCVLSYRRPKALWECIESIDATADYPFELIVHDDGSGVPEDVEVLEVARSRGATVILNKAGHNQGVGEAVRRMFQLASGDYLFKIDQDCTFEEGWLSEMVDILGYDGVATVGGFRYWFDPVDHRKMLRSEQQDYDEVEDYVSSVLGVRAALWDRIGWETHSEAFAEDVEFKRRCTEGGYHHALTKRDVVRNNGFGIGPSTVVEAPGKVATIHKGPFINAR